MSPQEKTAKLGDTVRFKCHSYGKAKWLALEDEDRNKFGNLPDNAIADGNYLILRKITLNMPSVYECWGYANEFYQGSVERTRFAARIRLTISRF